MENSGKAKKAGDTGDAAQPARGDDIRPAEYLRAVKAQLRNGKQKDAFVLLQQASIRFPDDPFILSYFGCFQAVVDKKYRSGVETCKKSIALLKKSKSFDEELLLPVFYLNLGRAYVAGGKRKDAIDAFHQGLKYDNGNKELWKDLRGLGERKKPTVPFLDRSNLINIYLGKMLKKGQREKVKNGGR